MNKKKINKILLLTDGIFPFVMGGMQKHSYFLLKHLTQIGLEVEVAHCSSNLDGSDGIQNAAFDSFNKNKISITHFTFPKIDSFPGHYLRESKKYSNILFDFYKDSLEEYDVIYSQGFTAWAFLGKKISPLIFANFHGYEMYQEAPSFRVKMEHLLLRSSVKKISIESDFVFSFGGVISDILYKIGVSKDKIIESPIGIENDWLNTNSLNVNKVRKFVFIGRYERRKGIEELNEAINRLDKNAKAEFHFIGPIGENKKIDHSSVIYHGSISDPDKIKNILKISDVLLCASYSEGMPTVIMEAMASGLAILTTNVGAISKQVSDQNGIVLDEPNPKDILLAIKAFIKMDDQDLLEMKKVSLMKIKKKFLWTNVVSHKINEMTNKINN